MLLDGAAVHHFENIVASPCSKQDGERCEIQRQRIWSCLNRLLRAMPRLSTCRQYYKQLMKAFPKAK